MAVTLSPVGGVAAQFFDECIASCVSLEQVMYLVIFCKKMDLISCKRVATKLFWSKK